MRYPPIALVLLVLLASRAHAQVALQVWHAPPGESFFGSTLDALGDVTGDGVSDVAVSSSIFGDAFVLSGADGSVVHHFSDMGGLVVRAGDVNGDGVPDVLIAWPPGTPSGPQLVQLRSGADGSVLVSISDEPMAKSLATVTDVDGDGARDIVVGSPAHDSAQGEDAGRVAVRSGADGALISAFEGTGESTSVGAWVVDLGDIDGDGRGDFAFNDADPLTPTSVHPFVRVVSGASGATLQVLEAGFTAIGSAGACAIDDLDGDARPELFVGFASLEPGLTHGRIHSTADWSVLFTLPGFSGRPIRVGDVDGDGQADIACLHSASGGSPWKLEVRSLATAQVLFDIGSPDALVGDIAPLQDLDGDGRVEFVVGDFSFDDSTGRVLLFSLVPGSVTSVQPSTLATGDVATTLVHVQGHGLEFADSLHVGDVVVPLDDPSITQLGPDELTWQPSLPAVLGPGAVSVVNAGVTPGAAGTLTYTATYPPYLQAASVTFSGQPFAWSVFGSPGQLAAFLLAPTPSTILVKGWPLLRDFILVTTFPLDPIGVGGLTLVIPPSVAGLTFYSQFATLQGGLVGTTNVTQTLIAF